MDVRGIFDKLKRDTPRAIECYKYDPCISFISSLYDLAHNYYIYISISGDICIGDDLGYECIIDYIDQEEVYDYLRRYHSLITDFMISDKYELLLSDEQKKTLDLIINPPMNKPVFIDDKEYEYVEGSLF